MNEAKSDMFRHCLNCDNKFQKHLQGKEVFCSDKCEREYEENPLRMLLVMATMLEEYSRTEDYESLINTYIFGEHSENLSYKQLLKYITSYLDFPNLDKKTKDYLHHHPDVYKCIERAWEHYILHLAKHIDEIEQKLTGVHMMVDRVLKKGRDED